MAVIRRSRPQPPTTIDKFFGVNQDTTGDTQLNLGESPKLVNYRIIEGYKAQKREGYKELFASLGDFDVQGMWYGLINDVFYFLFAANGKIYKQENGINTELGTLTDAKTFFFYSNGKVYIRNGYEYKYFDGSTFGTVAGYRPLIATATPPAGGGTNAEVINGLTGAKRQWFSPDGVAKDFFIREKAIDSIDYVKNMVTGAAITAYTADLVNGKVTFTTAPTGGTPDSIEIGWTKGTSDRALLDKYPFAMFYGGKNDTRIFLYGVDNVFYYSGLADGVPSVEYIPVTYKKRLGSDEYNITDIVRHFDRLVMYTNREAWYSYNDTITDAEGNIIPDFPTAPLNNKGNIAPGQTQVVRNNPFTIADGVYEWKSTAVRDERGYDLISQRVHKSLDSFDRTKAITLDWEEKSEYWLCVGKVVLIYNYRLDVWYPFELTDTPTCFMVVDGELYFGTTLGQIMKFDKDLRNDNGVKMYDYGELHFYDWGISNRYKNMTKGWISINPNPRSSLTIRYHTDSNVASAPIKKYYNMLTFKRANFGHWSFKTNYNPQPFMFEIDTEPFAYAKISWQNDCVDETVTILSITLSATIAGEIE